MQRRMALEWLEPRTLLAVLPAATVLGQVNISDPSNSLPLGQGGSRSDTTGNESSPSIVINPLNANQLVAVWTRFDPSNNTPTPIVARAAYSNNGGASWTAFTIGGVLTDPTSAATNPQPYAQTTDAQVAFDRNNNVYILTSQHNAANSSGVLLLNKFNFASGAPVKTINNKILHAWSQDQVLKPTLAVDSSEASYTDPDGGVHINPGAGNVYVAWSTNDGNWGNFTNWNPNALKLIASNDGGQTFSGYVTLNDNGNFGAARHTGPRLAVSQGTITGVAGASSATMPAGQVTVVWNDFGTGASAGTPFDVIWSDQIQGAAVSVQAETVSGPIFDAGPNNTPVATNFPFTVSGIPVGASAYDLTVQLAVTHPAVNELRFELVAPNGAVFTLAPNGTGGFTGANLGFGPTGTQILGTTLSDAAPRPVAQGAAPFVGTFQPTGGSLRNFLASLGAAANGVWNLRITDNTTNNVGTLREAVITFTTGLQSVLDRQVATTLVRGSAGQGGLITSAATPFGIGPAPVVAVDNTLGRFSPFQGRIYVAFTDRSNADGNPDDNTDIHLVASDNGGLTWTALGGEVLVNDDNAFVDGFSEASGSIGGAGGRPQFLPNVAVDPATGTLVVSYFDTRYDPARARVATMITTSIDGGATYAPSTFANRPQSAIDLATGTINTGQTVILGPIPDNQSTGATSREAANFAFGDRQGLAVLDGRVYPAWSSNENGGNDGKNLLDIRMAQVRIANGPRIISGTMGPVSLTDQFGNSIDSLNPRNPVTGAAEVRAFEVEFDRLINPNSFTAADVTIIGRDADGNLLPAISPANITITRLNGTPNLASRFRVSFPPQSTPGTYSYAIGPNITDRIDIRGSTLVPVATNTFTASGAQVGLAVPPVGTGGSGVAAQDITNSTILVSGLPGNRQITDVNVNLVLNHTFVTDLTIALISPSGTRVVLYDGNNAQFFGADFAGTTFDDQAATSITVGIPPFAGSFQPEQPLAQLFGEAPNGIWRLEINDRVAFDTGVLVGWSLDIQTGTVQTGFRQGNPMDQDADGTAGEAQQDRFAAPSSRSGTPFTLPYVRDTLPLIVPGPHVISTRVPGAPVTADNLVTDRTVSAIDLTFDRDMQVGTFTRDDVLRIIGPYGLVAGQSSPNVQVYAAYNATGTLTIPAGATLTSTLNVPNDGGAFTLADLNVRLDITTARTSGLTVTLIAPDGTRVLLFNGVGGLGQNFRDTVLDDAAALAIGNAQLSLAPFNGSFRPAELLSQLNGRPLQGAWQLEISNASTAPGAATLNSWSLEAVPQSPTEAVLARTFRVTFPAQQYSGTYQVQIGPEIYSAPDLNNPLTPGKAYALDSNYNAGVEVLRGASSTGQTQPLTVANTTPVNLVAGQAVTSQIVITEDFLIQGLTLQLDITYPNVPDLKVELIGPDGTVVRLFDPGIGTTGTRANLTNTVFDDAAGLPIELGGAPFLGRFRPQVNPPLQPGDPRAATLGALVNFSSIGGASGLGAGVYTLRVTNTAATNPIGVARLNRWSLTFEKPVSSSGLGEPVADRYQTSFRVFTMDPTNPISSTAWTAVGPAAAGNTSARIGAIAIDPSDPSGNTMFVAGAVGGVWKTHNFLTTEPEGPTWVPLTDFGPTTSVNVSSIAVFGRNNDPNQSIVLVGTGDYDGTGFSGSGGPGVGFLLSFDGGATWTVLDSRTNFDAQGNPLPINSPLRDHVFVGSTVAKVLVDPRPTVNGDVIAYAAVSGPAGGLWRTLDSGRTWQLMRAGQATDVEFDPNSGRVDAITNPTGNLQVIYSAFRGDGVYISPNQGQNWNLMAGGVGKPLVRDIDQTTPPPVPVSAPTNTPNGAAKGRIVLAKPARVPDTEPNAAIKNLVYANWLYAAVANTAGNFDGLYLTKDNGDNWVRIELPVRTINGVDLPSNDSTLPDNDITTYGFGAFGNYTLTLAVDPTNPNIVYLGGIGPGFDRESALIRIDVTGVNDSHAFFMENALTDGGLLKVNANGAAVIKQADRDGPIGGAGYDPRINPFINMVRNPTDPFGNGTFYLTRTASLGNSGANVRWKPFDFGIVDKHRLLTFRDPVTGHARVVLGDDQGIWTVVDDGGTQTLGTRGTAAGPAVSRIGNLQIHQFYYGAVQPSALAAQVAGALFYGNAQDDGFPSSQAGVLTPGSPNYGNINWRESTGDGGGVATNQSPINPLTGAFDPSQVTVYRHAWPCCGGDQSDFFRVANTASGFGGLGFGRTNGLIQPASDTTQWADGTKNFAVNPIAGSQIVYSSGSGRIFRTLDGGLNWFIIGEPANLGNATQALAMAFGAPPVGAPPGNLGDYIIVGTLAGQVWVTYTGGGTSGSGNAWTNINNGDLAGNTAPVRAIVTNPARGSREAYLVTANSVYHTPDTQTGTWRRITGNLFALTHDPFGDPRLRESQLGGLYNTVLNQRNFLNALAVDWRYVIPDDFSDPTALPTSDRLTHPVLYVGGIGGMYRSDDDGKSWTSFSTGLPNAAIVDLDMALGNIDPTTGRAVAAPGDPNALVAFFNGRGAYAIRLAPQVFENTATQPGILSVAPASRFQGNSQITTSFTPFIAGLSAQSAFGNTVTIRIYDADNDPSLLNPIGVGTTDANGRFQVQIQPGAFTTTGLKTIAIQATDQSGTKGNVARLSFYIGTGYFVDLAPESDTGRPRTPDSVRRDEDDITNVVRPTFQGVLDPGATVQFFVNGQPAGAVQTNPLTGEYRITVTVPLNEGPNLVTLQLTDAKGNVGPISSPLTVTLDTDPPGALSPALAPASDTGPSSSDGITSDNTPTFINSVDSTGQTERAEPFALVQIYAQRVNDQGQVIGPVFLIGEALADANGIYSVTAGQYVQPINPPPTIPNLLDGKYFITAVQLDIAGNVGELKSFGAPGTVIIDGTDANDHGYFDPVARTNVDGWIYIEKALNNIGPNVTNGNTMIVALGAAPTASDGKAGTGGGFFMGTGNAGGAIRRGFTQSILFGAGWTLVHVDGAANIDAFLSGQPVTGQAIPIDSVTGDPTSTTPISIPNVRLSDTGILYITTANQATGDIDNKELAVLNAHGLDIASYVNNGGGLFSHAETPAGFGGGGAGQPAPYGWLTSIFAGIVVNQFNGLNPQFTLTPEGQAAFPGLTPADLQGGPWHNYFTGDLGLLVPLATATGPGNQQVPVILTSIGAVITPLTIVIDTTIQTPSLSLAPSSDSFFSVTNPNGTFVVGSNSDNKTNVVNNPLFTVLNGENGARIELFRAPVVNGVVGTPVRVNAQTVTVPPGSPVTIADLNDLNGDGVSDGPIADGEYEYTVFQADLAGNVSGLGGPVRVFYDSVAPVQPGAPVLNPADDSGFAGDNITNVKRPRFQNLFPGAAEPGSTIQLIDVSGSVLGQAVVNANGTYTVQPAIDLPDGIYTFRVRAVDLVGNLSVASAATPPIQIQSRPPTAIPPATISLRLVQADDTGISNLDNLTIGSNDTSFAGRPRFTGTAPAGVIDAAGQIRPNRVELVDVTNFPNPATWNSIPATALAAPITVAADGTFGVITPMRPLNPLSDGLHRLVARIIDIAGNISYSAVLVVTIDTTPPLSKPTLTLLAADNTGKTTDTVTANRRPRFTGRYNAALDGARLTIELFDPANPGVALASTTAGADGSYTIQLPSNLNNGRITLQARVVDNAGNRGTTASDPLTVTIISLDDDYDNDGKSDPAVYRSSNALWSILQSGSQPTAYAKTTVTFLASGATLHDVPLTGDLDGDGKADTIIYRADLSQFQANRSTRGLMTPITLGTPGNSIPALADYDGDNITDLAVYVQASTTGAKGQWLILESSTGLLRTVSIGTAANANDRLIPVPGDYNGDGKLDLALFHSATGLWEIDHNSDGVIDATIASLGAAGTAAPVPGDYDGDGVTDAAIWNPATFTWTVRNSSDGKTAATKLTTWRANDVAVPGDYDGDGKTDMAVYRPSTGAYLFRLSGGGTLTNKTPGAANDLPVQATYAWLRSRGQSQLLPLAPRTSSSSSSSSTGRTTTTVTSGGTSSTAAPVVPPPSTTGSSTTTSRGTTTTPTTPTTPAPAASPISSLLRRKTAVDPGKTAVPSGRTALSLSTRRASLLSRLLR